MGQVGAPRAPREVGQDSLRHGEDIARDSDHRLRASSSAKKSILSLGRSTVLREKIVSSMLTDPRKMAAEFEVIRLS